MGYWDKLKINNGMQKCLSIYKKRGSQVIISFFHVFLDLYNMSSKLKIYIYNNWQVKYT